MKKLKERILKNFEQISFKLKTEKYGRAEFAICPIWKYGKLRKIIITPQQQPSSKEYFVINCNWGVDNFTVKSYQHKGFELPKIWIFGWCPEHKTQFFRVYPPNRVTKFTVIIGSSIDIVFE